MGAYVAYERSYSEVWKLAVRKRQELILGPQYLQAMHDECIMAVVFGYILPLLEKILLFSLSSEHEEFLSLFTDKFDIMINNRNQVISNFGHIH